MITQQERQDMQDVLTAIRTKNRNNQLKIEYSLIKDFKVVLQSPDGSTNISFRLEELFEMFELTRNPK